jgi:hypothetical protein
VPEVIASVYHQIRIEPREFLEETSLFVLPGSKVDIGDVKHANRLIHTDIKRYFSQSKWPSVTG